MENTLNIVRNTYVQPTEIRIDVVQKICEALLNHHAFSNIEMDAYPGPTLFVYADKNTNKGLGFDSREDPFWKDRRVYFRMRTCEVQKAFEELINAGYYMFKTRGRYGRYSYHCGRKPEWTSWTGAVRCTRFDEFID